MWIVTAGTRPACLYHSAYTGALMKTSELEGAELDYWVARGLHDFIREIHFTDGGQTLAIRGNDRGRAWDGAFLPSTSWEAAAGALVRARRLAMNHTQRRED